MDEGIKNIWTPHSKKKVQDLNPDYVIYSTAVTDTNDELIWAKENKKQILHRSDLLEIATSDHKLIAVSGTHGKTTTSSMIFEILKKGGKDPSAFVGGIINSLKTNVIAGNGEYFIVEADESDKSFLKGEPYIGVITNIEPDHLENYPGGFKEIKDSFTMFAKNGIKNKGLVSCMQDPVTHEIISSNFDLDNEKIITYSINNNPTKTKTFAIENKAKGIWDFYYKNKLITSIKLKMPGFHNILNALAAFSTTYLLGINSEKIKEALEEYSGVKRRFEVIGKTNDITIVDDYAHHPTEIALTIKAAKELNPKRLIAVIQPHQPLRLKFLWNEFIEIIKNEDCQIFITETYIARGNHIEGINSIKLVEETNKPNVKYLPGNTNQIAESLLKLVKPGDLILIMGAGNITNVGTQLLKLHEGLLQNSGTTNIN
jgi:UDP-N-acetylmuramate--alanine ligase